MPSRMFGAIGVALLLVACADRQDRAEGDGIATSSRVADAKRYEGRRFGNVGRPATDAEIRAVDIDANSEGNGLPPGRGTYARGVAVYASQCASCHGPKGEGIAPNPKLVGREPADFSFANDPKIPKTIGNYWPYATTLFDYINRAMPFATPGTLSAGDVYSVTAFLLVANGIIDSTQVIDARSLPAVRMPSRDRFVIDDRKGGPSFR